MPARENLGTRIEKLRGMASMSMRELDTLADLQQGHTRYIQTGDRKRVTAHTISQIANVFGVSIDWLFCGSGDAPANETVTASVERARRSQQRKARGQQRRTGTSG